MKRITLKKKHFLRSWMYRLAELCVEELNEFIVVPEEVEKLDVVFHKHPGKNRMKVVLPDKKSDDVEVDGESVTLCCDTDEFLFRHFKKNETVYVEFEY